VCKSGLGPVKIKDGSPSSFKKNRKGGVTGASRREKES